MADADWYEKHKTDVAVALKRAKTVTKEEPVYCALVRMKDATDLVCAHVNLTKQASMVKEGRAAKAKVVSAGRLFAGPDGPTFEVSEGDLSIKARFGKAAALALGSPMNVIVVGAEAPAAPAPEGAAADALEPLRAALAKLAPAVQQAVKDYPDKKDELLQPLALCQQHIKDNNAVEAKAQLAEGVRRVKALGGAPSAGPPGAAAASKPPAGPSPTPNGAPQAPPAGAAALAAVQAALAQTTPAIQKAVQDHPERKSEVLAPLARCQQQIKDNQPTEARATLLEIGRILKTMAPPAGSKPAAAGADPFREMYHDLLETVPGDLQQLRGADPAAADKVQKVVDGAAAFAAKRKFQSAFKYLNQAADAIAKAASASRAQEAADAIPEGKVQAMKAALSQAQSKWDAALAAVRARLKPIQATLRENFPNAAVGMKNILDSYEQELLDGLQAAAKADGEGLAAAVRDALGRVQALRTEAAGDKVFAFLEKCGTPVKAAFAQAFTEVESLLQA